MDPIRASPGVLPVGQGNLTETPPPGTVGVPRVPERSATSEDDTALVIRQWQTAALGR